MAHDNQMTDDSFQPLHLALFLGGGFMLGIGILGMGFSFGAPSGDLNQNLDVIGFSGIDNITTLGPFVWALPMLLAGAICLIFANSIAWQKTGGY